MSQEETYLGLLMEYNTNHRKLKKMLYREQKITKMGKYRNKLNYVLRIAL